MNWFIHRMLGHYLQNEAGAEGGEGSGAAAAPDAAAPAAPAAAAPTPADQQQEAKPDDAGNTEKPQDGAETGAPEQYADFTLPEGVEMDADTLGTFKELAKELGISQSAAQKLIDLQTGMEAKRGEAMERAVTEQAQRWESEVRNDPELGGANFDKTVETASKVIQSFGDPALTQLLNDSGLGNHPALVKFCHRIGQAISEDRLVLPGSQTETASKRTADVMFGELFNK